MYKSYTLVCLYLLVTVQLASTVIVAEDLTADTEAERAFIRSLVRRLNPGGQSISVKASESGVLDGCASAPAFPVGRKTVITVPTKKDGDRSFILYIPSSYEQLHARRSANTTASMTTYTPAALQLMLHGLNDNCEHFLDATGFIDYAEKSGYIVASACGSGGVLGTGWNAGMCCGFFGESPDDVGLARSIVQVISEGVCVDRTKVMAMGLSNGAMLSEVLGCRAPDIFRVVVSVSGVVEMRDGNEDGLRKCSAAIAAEAVNQPVRRPSVLMVHGDADGMVPWGGSRLLGFPDMPSNVQGWVERNGCEGAPIHTINTTKYVNSIHENCMVPTPPRSAEGGWGSTVEVVQVIGGGHNWPRDDTFCTTDYIYEFGLRVFGSY